MFERLIARARQVVVPVQPQVPERGSDNTEGNEVDVRSESQFSLQQAQIPQLAPVPAQPRGEALRAEIDGWMRIVARGALVVLLLVVVGGAAATVIKGNGHVTVEHALGAVSTAVGVLRISSR